MCIYVYIYVCYYKVAKSDLKFLACYINALLYGAGWK